MSVPNPTSLDFTAPRRLTGSASRALTSWHATSVSVLQEFWQALLGNRITLTPAQVDSSVAQKAQQALPDPGYGVLLKIGHDRFDGVVAFSSRIVLTLVSEMLGTLGDAWPENRALTPAEQSLFELLLGEISRAMSQGWPEVEPLPVEMDQLIVRPLRSRIFQPRENLVRIGIDVHTPVGSDTAWLLMPQAGLTSIGINETAIPTAPVQTASPQMRSLAESLPVTLVVGLGSASLTLGELNRLAAGDILVLDQSASAPLEATIAGRLQWLGHPCRLGQRQGFRILASAKE